MQNSILMDCEKLLKRAGPHSRPSSLKLKSLKSLSLHLRTVQLSWQSGRLQRQRSTVRIQSSANFCIEHLRTVNWIAKAKIRIRGRECPFNKSLFTSSLIFQFSVYLKCDLPDLFFLFRNLNRSVVINILLYLSDGLIEGHFYSYF